MLEQIVSVNDDWFLADLFCYQTEHLIELLEANLIRLEVIPPYCTNTQILTEKDMSAYLTSFFYFVRIIMYSVYFV